ncbi:MAG TPA: family 43 glycosylhydrolase, partial [Mycobacterium sp.]|nr:family 43 glycosylhydrolase [Mycobacterium sp.]
LTVDPSYGETHLWAPYVLKSGGRWYMFYAAGGPDSTQSELSVATSPDLWHWTRYRNDPLFRDGFDARDPFVLRVGAQWVMYYDATSDPAGGNHIVAYRTSTDLLHWSTRHIAFTDPSTGTFGGPTESPYVVRHNGAYYLFLGPRGGYVGTDVFVSHDPLHFDVGKQVGHIASHALEVVQDTDGSWWVTAAGWGQGGVYLAPLDWDQEIVTSGLQVSAPTYRLSVQTAPTAGLTSLAAPIDGQWRELLDNSFRGTVPYLGVGGFGATDPPGAPAAVNVGADSVALSGIPMGNEPVTADWTFAFDTDWFDMTLGWQVTGALSALAFEVAWSLDTALPRVGDPAGLDRSGDVPGFPHWTLAGDDSQSLVAAYRQGSAWAQTNHWFDPPDGALSWQPLWAPGGSSWPAGDYAGGTWRIGVSAQPADTAFAEQLYAGVNA